MSSFDILVIAHLIGDYLFQVGWMAANKAKKWSAAFIHSAVYTLTIAAFVAVFVDNFSPWGYLLIFISHAILDRRFIPSFWVASIMSTPESQRGWLTIVVDQIFHLLILFAALYL